MKEITPKDLEPMENPGDGWFIIEAAGEHPSSHSFGGQRVEFAQHLTPEVLARIAEAGVPAEGLFIDKDHSSLDPRGSSEACGWVRELAMCMGNLAARIEWTPIGLPLIQGKIYRHFSSVYPPDEAQMRAGRVEPTRLIGLALCNDPNNAEGQPPITNRAQEGAPTPLPPPSGSETENMNTDTTPTTMEYPAKLLAALGLAEGASEDEIIAAAEGMAEKAARCAEAEQAAATAAEAEADATISAEESAAGVELTEEEKEEVKEELIANRKHGLRFLNLLCNSKRSHQPKAPTRRYADRSSSSPSAIANRRPAASAPEEGLNHRAHELCRKAAAEGRSLSYTAARALAEREAKH